MLEREGYHVLETGDALEAIHLVQQGEHAIDVAVVDAVLPAPGSPAVLDALRHRTTPGRLILMSAYDRSALQRRADVAALLSVDGLLFLEKPFSLRALSAAIAELLAIREDRVHLVTSGEWRTPDGSSL